MPSQTLCDTTDTNIAATRVARLRNITQDQYNALYRKIHPRLPLHVADDAFSHAMAVASQKYDGRVPLENFVSKVARNYAFGHYRKQHKSIQFTDLHHDDSQDGEDINAVEALGTQEDRVEDPYKLIFAKRVTEILRGEMLVSEGKGERLTLERAAMALEELMQAAGSDCGVGVDEYEEESEKMSAAHPVKAAPRQMIEERLAEMLSVRTGQPVSKKTVENVMSKLRHLARPLLGLMPELSAIELLKRVNHLRRRVMATARIA